MSRADPPTRRRPPQLPPASTKSSSSFSAAMTAAAGGFSVSRTTCDWIHDLTAFNRALRLRWHAFASTGIAPQQLPPNNYRRFKQWWTSMIGPAGNRSSQEREQTVVYIAWNIWKERCRRVFDHKSLTISQLILLIRQDIQNWQTAHTTWEDELRSTTRRCIGGHERRCHLQTEDAGGDEIKKASLSAKGRLRLSSRSPSLHLKHLWLSRNPAGG
ncbi:hypothetical protein HU200_027092 [Digitaria exilis]|uniref:Uncharacterized protein n=1 Tax=Digitaria exilis TaxID=1010633 RepID=A0A835BU96_9POAL|nr:hypothetical protein HU200_027092 [Digitaria exilis]